ncbi:hypothetical protein D3C73_1380940 [compost metagenome]
MFGDPNVERGELFDCLQGPLVVGAEQGGQLPGLDKARQRGVVQFLVQKQERFGDRKGRIRHSVVITVVSVNLRAQVVVVSCESDLVMTLLY